MPDELKARTDTKGESSLRGHLKADGDEQTGSQSYIPPDPKNDKALKMALDLIRGTTTNAAYPPNPKAACRTDRPGRLDMLGAAQRPPRFFWVPAPSGARALLGKRRVNDPAFYPRPHDSRGFAPWRMT